MKQSTIRGRTKVLPYVSGTTKVVPSRSNVGEDFLVLTVISKPVRRWTRLTCMTDLRLALRLCLRHPLLSLAAIGSLALGIGANTAIFTVLNGSVLRPLPYNDPAT